MGLIGQGEGGRTGPMPGTIEQCRRDYERDIGDLIDKARATSRLHTAIMEYCDTIRPSLHRPDTFTFPKLIGHLILQERELNKSTESLVAEWENVKKMEK